MDLSAVHAPSFREGFFVVEIERFQGPLDLLLHLIRQQDLDIFDIPIARITDQFLSAIQGIHAGDLDNAGEFLEMAATLIRIKAQMLLPRRDEEEDEDPRGELVRRLLEYEQIREISARLATAEADRSRQHGKGYVEPRSVAMALDSPLLTTWDEVLEAALRVSIPERRDPDLMVAARPVAMEDKIQLILGTLRKVARVEFSHLLGPWKGRMHGVMTFLAGLELSRRRAVLLRQVRPFAELWLYRRDEAEWLEEDGDRDEDGPGPAPGDPGHAADGGAHPGLGADTPEPASTETP